MPLTSCLPSGSEELLQNSNIQLLLPEYQFTHLVIGPRDLGHTGLQQEATGFAVLHNTHRVNYLFCIHQAFEIISAALKKSVKTTSADYMIPMDGPATTGCIHQFVMASHRRKRYRPDIYLNLVIILFDC